MCLDAWGQAVHVCPHVSVTVHVQMSNHLSPLALSRSLCQLSQMLFPRRSPITGTTVLQPGKKTLVRLSQIHCCFRQNDLQTHTYTFLLKHMSIIKHCDSF